MKWISWILVFCITFSGCSSSKQSVITEASPETEGLNTADTSGMEFYFEEADTVASDSKDAAALNVNSDTSSTTDAGVQTYYISSGGTYTLSGEINDIMVTVDADNADVNLILNGVTINNSGGPAIYVRSADKVTLTLAEGSTNTLSDGYSYSITDSDSTLDAAIFSKADLTINGTGTLNLTGNYKHGIVSKDDLIISSGTLNVTSAKVGLNGKDCVKIGSGNMTIQAGSDGIRSDNDEDISHGYVYLYGGSVDITSGNDGIQAETVINVENVDLTIKAGGGSGISLTSSEESYKGMKAGSDIYITGGYFDIDSLDDCIHSNGTITIADGVYVLSSGDDGVHADTDLSVSGSGTALSILKSYEGMEATNLMISGGTIDIVASDDGLNAAGGNDSSGIGGRHGMGNFSSSTGKIVISGGTVMLYASGDGLDANGTIAITGGDVTVIGPISGDTAILDFDTTGTISSGTFIGVGSSNMAQNFSSSSSQGAMLVKTGTQSEGTTIRLADSSGNVLLSYTAQQSFSCVILSHPSIVQGNTYTLTVGSSSMTITMDSTVYSSSGNASGMDRGMGGMGMNDQRGNGQMPDMGGNHSGKGMGGRSGGKGRNP